MPGGAASRSLERRSSHRGTQSATTRKGTRPTNLDLRRSRRCIPVSFLRKGSVNRGFLLTRVGSISGHILGDRMLQRSLVATLSFALLVGSAVSADDKKDDKKNAAALADVQKKETFTENQVAAELAKLATWCVAQNGPDDARRVLDLGLQIYPENKALKKQKDDTKDTKQAPSKKYRDELKKKEHDAYEKCAKLIG